MEEYEKIMEERKKALASTKTEERKVKMDKVFESMKQLCVKKETDEVFIQLVSPYPNLYFYFVKHYLVMCFKLIITLQSNRVLTRMPQKKKRQRGKKRLKRLACFPSGSMLGAIFQEKESNFNVSHQ